MRNMALSSSNTSKYRPYSFSSPLMKTLSHSRRHTGLVLNWILCVRWRSSWQQPSVWHPLSYNW